MQIVHFICIDPPSVMLHLYPFCGCSGVTINDTSVTQSLLFLTYNIEQEWAQHDKGTLALIEVGSFNTHYDLQLNCLILWPIKGAEFDYAASK